jgi:hypothetical protein
MMPRIKSFARDGSSVPFDPAEVAVDLAGCMLCGGPIAVVGVFHPQTAEMQTAVLRLRTHVIAPGLTPALAYGLCRHDAEDPEAPDRVEAAILAAAQRVTAQ